MFKENLGIFSKKNYFIEVKKTSLEKRIILGKEFFFSFTKSFLVLYQVFASLGRPTIKKLLLAFGLVDISSPRFFTLNQIEEWDNFFFH